MKKRSAYKWKVPLVSFLISLGVMLLVFLPMIFFVGGHMGLTEKLLDDMGPGSVGGGWLILPAMIGDFGIGVATLFFGILLFVYIVAAVIITLWNVIWNCCNRKEKKWMLAVSLIPCIIIAGLLLVETIRMFISIKMFRVFLFVVPAFILLMSQVWQYKLFMKKEEVAEEPSSNTEDYM